MLSGDGLAFHKNVSCGIFIWMLCYVMLVLCMVIQDIKGSCHKLRRRTACCLTRRSAKNMMKGDEGLTLRQKIAGIAETKIRFVMF